MASVEGTFNGSEFQVCLQPDGEGGHWMKVEPELSTRAGVVAGDTVELEISRTSVEPEPEVPADLFEALSVAPKALAVWKDTTAIARRDWISWMSTGKKVETRVIRIEKMIDMLSKGKRRICCYDRSGIAGKNFSCPVAADESEETKIL